MRGHDAMRAMTQTYFPIVAHDGLCTKTTSNVILDSEEYVSVNDLTPTTVVDESSNFYQTMPMHIFHAYVELP